MKNLIKLVSLVLLCLTPFLYLSLPVYAWNAKRAKSVGCVVFTNQGPVTAAHGSTCEDGGTVCSANDCPPNTHTPEF